MLNHDFMKKGSSDKNQDAFTETVHVIIDLMRRKERKKKRKKEGWSDENHEEFTEIQSSLT